MSNFVIQGYANLENVNANNMDLFYATMSAQLSTFFPILSPASGSLCNGVGNIINNYGQVGTSNVFNFTNGAIRFLDQVTNLTTDISIKPCYANYAAATVTVTCPISVTQYYVVAVLSFNTPTDPFTTSTSVIISPTAMTLAQIAAQPTPSLYNPIFAITTTDGTNYTIHLDNNCAFNYGFHITGNQYPDITDVAGLVSIIGSGGLSVNVGPGIFKSFANFVDDSTSAKVSITRNTTARPGSTLSIVSESTVSGVVPGFSTLALIELSGSSAPTLGASYDFGTRWYLTTAIPGDAPASTNPKALVIMGDLGIVQQFSVTDSGGNSWVLTCESISGPFPTATGVLISGYSQNYLFPAPGSTTNSINLLTAGIITGAATLVVHADTTLLEASTVSPQISFLDVFSGTGTSFVNIMTITSGVAFNSSLQFQLLYK